MRYSKAFGRVSAFAAAAGLALALALPGNAAGTALPKEENIYVRLSGGGVPQSVYVVNMFAPEQDTVIEDHGRYENLRCLSGDIALTVEGDTITAPAAAGSFYYQGDLPGAVLPWSISLTYTLDGKPIEAAALGGQSGHLVLTGEVTKNAACDSGFFEAYMIQSVLSLDTVKCRNIQASGATMANVGSNKQLTYMKLPGQELHFTVEADVVDFTLGGISFNAVPFALRIQPDTSAIGDKLGELTDGAIQLDDGAQVLESGTIQLTQGIASLRGGADRLNAGTAELCSGAAALHEGAAQLNEGLTLITDNNAALNDGAVQITDAVLAAANEKLRGYGLLCEDMTWENYEETLTSLIEDSRCLKGLLVRANRETLEDLRTQLGKVRLFRDSLALYTDSVAQAADGAQTLLEGTAQLQSGAQELHSGTSALVSGTAQLAGGAGELRSGARQLTNGTGLLRTSTDGLDGQLNEAVDALLSKLTGGDWQPVSFVSEKNENVKAVQFVMTTPAIEKPVAEAPVEEPAAPLSWWQRLLALFTGIFKK